MCYHPHMTYATAGSRDTNGETNRLYAKDRAVHAWYRFVLSFPPHLVRQYLDRFSPSNGVLLDPFCGTGTVLVEAKKRGYASEGIEANAVAHFACQTKVAWDVDPDGLLAHARAVAAEAEARLQTDGVPDIPRFQIAGSSSCASLRTLPDEAAALILADSLSPLPMHKALVLLEAMQELRDDRYWAHERLALAKSLVFNSSNLHFRPEVGVGKPKLDAPVVGPWLAGVAAMADDLRLPQVCAYRDMPAQVYHADARQAGSILQPRSIAAVITSPPYPNEKDYTRATRLESVLLGFTTTQAAIRAMKKGLVRSNTRSVYSEDNDQLWVDGHPEIERIAAAIEARRIELGKTSGFERLYARLTKLYFGGMARHLAGLRPALQPGAHLAYVVGDQASYLRVMIRTGALLADIARSLGYELEGIDLFRTRMATATGAQLREEVVVLRWPG
jgi:DNA modification methylase